MGRSPALLYPLIEAIRKDVMASDAFMAMMRKFGFCRWAEVRLRPDGAGLMCVMADRRDQAFRQLSGPSF